jgi:hypothetical protein
MRSLGLPVLVVIDMITIAKTTNNASGARECAPPTP